MTALTLLTSYPKSGNTWVRAVLDSVQRGGGAIDINANLAGTSVAAARHLFDRTMGLEASDLTEEEITGAQPLLWPLIAQGGADPCMIKVHDALVPPRPGVEPLFSSSVVAAVVYVARDPRDVAVSFAHHFGTSADDAITWMADPATTLDSIRGWLPKHLPQLVSSWSRHVESWLDTPGLRLHLMRYEDMRTDPQAAFAAVIRFLGLEADASTVARAVAAARFEALRAQEEAAGFLEREPHMDCFFRRGIVGGWRDSLTPAQAERIVCDHGAMMRRLGYLS
jgi:aryl sulfotransferase